MSVSDFALHVLVIVSSSLFLFYAMNYTGIRFREYQVVSLVSGDEAMPAFNLLFRILMPNAFVVLLGFIFKAVDLPIVFTYLWFIVPLQIVIRFLFNINRLMIFHWWRFIVTAVASTSISYFLTRKVLQGDKVLAPDFDALSGEFWVLLIIYLYTAFSRYLSETMKPESREVTFVTSSYQSLRNRFHKVIEKFDLWPDQQDFIYAVLVVENFNRPVGVRLLERVSSVFKSEGTYGVMQVKSKEYVSDEISLELGIQRILDLYEEIRLETKTANPEYSEEHIKWNIWARVAWFYNRSDEYAQGILSVVDQIEKIRRRGPKPSDDELDKLRKNALYTSEWV